MSGVRGLKGFLLAFTALLLVLASTAHPAAAFVKEPAVSGVYVEDPRYSVPAVVKAGDTLNITLHVEGGASVDVGEVTLVSLNKTVEAPVEGLEGAGTQHPKVVVRVPSDAEEGLYDLLIEVKVNGKPGVLEEPRSVWVLNKPVEKLAIAHIGDSDLGSFFGGKYSWEMYEASIVLANAFDLDAVIIVGDDVDVGNDVASLKTFYAQTNELRKPTFVIPGNHDWAQVSSSSDFNLKYYGKYVGPGYWVREVGRFVLIGLDAGFDNYLPDKELDWLEEQLGRYGGTDKTVVIIIHPPIVLNSGNYTAKDADELVSKYGKAVHGSWRAHMDSLRRFFNLVNRYENVRFILAGDTHKDAVALINGRIWLVTATAAGHANVYAYRGLRFETLYSNGSIEFWEPPGKDPYSTEASVNTDLMYVKVNHDKDFKMYAVSITTDPKFDLTLSSAPLYFYLNSSTPPASYELYGDVSSVKGVKHWLYGKYVVFEVRVDIRPSMNTTLVIASYRDEVSPKVKVGYYMPRRPIAGKQPVAVSISATDEGWGVKEVKLLYREAGSTKWVPVRAILQSPGQYRAQVPPLNVPWALIKAVAVDWAGNEASTDVINITYSGYKPPVTTTTATKTTATTTTTTTTTTITTTPPATTTTTPLTTTTVTTTTTQVPATTTTTITMATTTTTTPSTTTSPKTTTSPATTATVATTTTPPPAGGVPTLAIAVAIAVAVIAVAVAFLARRR